MQFALVVEVLAAGVHEIDVPEKRDAGRYEVAALELVFDEEVVTARRHEVLPGAGERAAHVLTRLQVVLVLRVQIRPAEHRRRGGGLLAVHPVKPRFREAPAVLGVVGLGDPGDGRACEDARPGFAGA